MFLGLAVILLLAGTGLQPLTILGLSFFCGGSLSNLLDRVVYGGAVDFLNLNWGGMRPYIFNVADIAIATGGIVALLSLAGNFAGMAFNRSAEPNR